MTIGAEGITLGKNPVIGGFAKVNGSGNANVTFTGIFLFVRDELVN